MAHPGPSNGRKKQGNGVVRGEPGVRRSQRGCVRKKRFPSPSASSKKKRRKPSPTRAEPPGVDSEITRLCKAAEQLFLLKHTEAEKEKFLNKFERCVESEPEERRFWRKEVKSNNRNSAVHGSEYCDEVKRLLRLLHTRSRRTCLTQLEGGLLERLILQALSLLGRSNGKNLDNTQQVNFSNTQERKFKFGKCPQQATNVTTNRGKSARAMGDKLEQTEAKDVVHNVWTGDSFMPQAFNILSAIDPEADLNAKPCCSGGGPGSFLAIRKTVDKGSVETPVTMSVAPAPVNRTQRRSRQTGVDYWEPKVRRTVGGSLDKEIKAAEELDRHVEEFRKLLTEITLSDEARNCCDQILQAVGVIREENDSTRKKNVSLRKIIKELRHSKTDATEEEILESKNKLLQEKVHADIQLELQARTIHEQAERIRALELQLQERDGSAHYWPQMNNTSAPQSFSEGSPAVSGDNYTELRPLNGPMIVNEPPGPASLAPLQTVSVNAAEGYPSQPYYESTPCQDRHENTGSNSWMLSPENSWMMKC